MSTSKVGADDLRISHVNLHYPRAEDGPLAAELLTMLGLTQTQVIPLDDGSNFYRFTIHAGEPNRPDGIVYLSRLPEPVAALLEEMRDRVAADRDDAHPAVRGARDAQEADPELNFHLGFLLGSLETLEARLLRLQALERTDDRYRGRMRFVVNRPPPGVAEVDERLDRSPIFKGVDRYTYGRNGVQAFVVTDLVVSGPLGEVISFELDYVFPGYDQHILSVSELVR